MGIFRFCSKFERVGKPRDVAENRWNLMSQSRCEKSISYCGFFKNYTLWGVKRDRREVRWVRSCTGSADLSARFRTILFVIKWIWVPRDNIYRRGAVIHDLCVATIIYVPVNNCELNSSGCLIKTNHSVQHLRKQPYRFPPVEQKTLQLQPVTCPTYLYRKYCINYKN